MSGAVLGVTLLAGIATLGASVFVIKGENKELLERKADERFVKSKTPYDFSLNRDGIERLKTLTGALLLQALKDPRMDRDRISRMTEAEFEELSRFDEDAHLILKDAPESKLNELVRRLHAVLKSDKADQASGKVVAWVLMIHHEGRSLLDSDVKLNYADAARCMMELYADPAFRFKERCRVALSACIAKKTQDVGRVVVDNDAFIRAFSDNRVMVKLMPLMDSKSTAQLANLEVIKRYLFDDVDLRDLQSLITNGSVHKFMKDYYMPRYASRLSGVIKEYEVRDDRKFTARIGSTGARPPADSPDAGATTDDVIARFENFPRFDVGATTNVVTIDDATFNATPLGGFIKATLVATRAFGYEDKIPVTIKRAA